MGSGGWGVGGLQERETVMEESNKEKMKGRDVKEREGCWPSVQW